MHRSPKSGVVYENGGFEMNFEDLLTEQRNRHSTHIDQVDTDDMVGIINREDQRVARSVQKQLPQISEAINLATKRFDAGGRLIYRCGGHLGDSVYWMPPN